MSRVSRASFGSMGSGRMAGAVEKAYVETRERILRGQYPPAARITEQEISDSAGVSRTPAREALRRLQSEGWCDSFRIMARWLPSGPMTTSTPSSTCVRCWSPDGAGRAARNIDSDGIAELRELANEQYRESVACRKGYLQRIGAINSQFHRALHRHANSPRLDAALSSLIEAPLMFQTFSRYTGDDLKRSAMHHLEIVDALAAHDSEWAGAVMRSHILAARIALRSVQRPAHGSGASAGSGGQAGGA